MHSAKKLHFLIHPDFSLHDEAKAPSQVEEGQNDNVKLYVTNARSLAHDEIVAIFLDVTRNTLLKDTNSSRAIVSMLRDMREILGKRVVVLSGQWKIFEEHGDEKVGMTMSTLKKLFQQRGYEFDASTPTVAYGESLLSCVADGANALNTAGLFQNETVVMPELTDYRDWDKDDLARKILALLNAGKHDCITFQTSVSPSG